jgi:two-component system OmpR family response regulator
MTRVLLAEDDAYLCNGLQMALKRKGYSVDAVNTGTEAQAMLSTQSFDVLLLDLGLPGLDGTEILADLRKKGSETPVIVITARDALEDKINGLDLGANDYLVKPFHFLELEARIRAVLRKTNWSNQVEIEFGSLKLNTNNGVLTVGDRELDLTPKEAVVLKTLMSRAGRVVSKRQIMDQVPDWGDESSENAVEIVVHRVRKKLENASVVINTVRGFGYTIEQINR